MSAYKINENIAVGREEDPMRRSGLRIWFLTVALVLGIESGMTRAQTFTQGDDPLLVTPEILVIVDTSGSMGDSGSYITDATTGRELCESDADGSTCLDCSTASTCSMCIDSTGSCASVNGYTDSGLWTRLPADRYVREAGTEFAQSASTPAAPAPASPVTVIQVPQTQLPSGRYVHHQAAVQASR